MKIFHLRPRKFDYLFWVSARVPKISHALDWFFQYFSGSFQFISNFSKLKLQTSKIVSLFKIRMFPTGVFCQWQCLFLLFQTTKHSRWNMIWWKKQKFMSQISLAIFFLIRKPTTQCLLLFLICKTELSFYIKISKRLWDLGSSISA